MAEPPSLRVVELYAGIGGFHFALIESGAKAEVVGSIDINTTSTQVRTCYVDTVVLIQILSRVAHDFFDRFTGTTFQAPGT